MPPLSSIDIKYVSSHKYIKYTYMTSEYILSVFRKFNYDYILTLFFQIKTNVTFDADYILVLFDQMQLRIIPAY